MRVHKLTFAALAVAATLSLTACQNDDVMGQGDPSAESTASSSGGGSGSGGSDEGAGKDSAGETSGGQQDTTAGTGSNENGSSANGSHANGKVGKCRTADLEITAMDNTIDGDPDGSVAVDLKNSSGRDCAISGYPGVDLKTSSGSLSAERTGQETISMILKNGKTVSFGINYPMNDSGGSGVRVTGLLVTPPDETKTVTLDWPGAATLPVTDGSGSPVKVGPIGSAGQGEG
ncbi:DUF4232 domain-containing protein [Streptomyces sp. NPDC058001]|uniref:DUF4232 domain-containing protein n=1 Tax=Streptomyces sp. NPDC058001 TaxID=3346300 RepID=UPI0036E2BB76